MNDKYNYYKYFFLMITQIYVLLKNSRQNKIMYEYITQALDIKHGLTINEYLLIMFSVNI